MSSTNQSSLCMKRARQTNSGAVEFLSIEQIRKARQAVASSGFLIIERAYPQDICREIVKCIDRHIPDNKTEIHYSGTEIRIWDAEKRDPIMEAFWRECNVFMSCMINQDSEAFTLLAIRNMPLDPSDRESLK